MSLDSFDVGALVWAAEFARYYEEHRTMPFHGARRKEVRRAAVESADQVHDAAMLALEEKKT